MAGNQEIITHSARDTQDVGSAIGARIKSSGTGGIFCLYGELGSGKTTFTQGLAEGMGITSRLVSPTFVLMRQYDAPASGLVLYHLDLYRLEDRSAISGLGLGDLFADPQAVVLIEWAERLGPLLPEVRTDIRFTPEGEAGRRIAIRKLP